jgi:hypothetical protein
MAGKNPTKVGSPVLGQSSSARGSALRYERLSEYEVCRTYG